ncbi:MAG: amino acid ABC transporter permease [Gammaproteobacteria bacterium]|nr:amino acid ABC transporter permease [Gammaproteobacteria bacterium]
MAWLNWIVDHTFGYIIKLIFLLIDLILPDTFTRVITKYGELFYEGIKNTLLISLVGTIIGLLIAIILGTIRSIEYTKRDSKIKKIVTKIFDYIIRAYVTVFRGTPMMVQAMIIYYGLVGILHFSAINAALIIVSINTGAYLTEVIHDGISSVDKGQLEGARSLGMSYFKSMTLIIFPQALKNSMASIGNEFVINIKDTSVLNVIGCAEMYYILKISAGEDYRFMETMIVGAIIYLILTLSTTKLLGLVEKKLGAPVQDIKSSN